MGLVLADVRSERASKERAVAELLAPLDAQLRRSERSFGDGGPVETLRAANQTARELLLAHSDLVPPELRPDADALVEHYDAWLERYQSQRPEDGPSGPVDIAFPSEAARRFRATYHRYLKELHRD